MPTETQDETILVFSAELQKETEHTVDVDDSGEILLTCTESGRTLKFPAGITGEELAEKLAEHRYQNEGQVTRAALDEKKAAILADLLGKPAPERESGDLDLKPRQE